MKKVLLISLYEDISSIGIRYLSSCLKSNGIGVTTVHMPLLGSTAKYVNKLDSSRDIKLLENTIRQVEPDLIGIGVMTNYFRRAANLALEIKKTCSVPVVFGGIHPTLCPEECLEFADIACIGEAEATILELCRIERYPEDLSKIRGIAYRNNGVTVRNEVRFLEKDLDKYPFPDYSLDGDLIIINNRIRPLDKNAVLELLPRYPFDTPSYKILTSRGCPYSCSYCCNYTLRKIWKGKGRYLRGRSVENVIDEMAEIKEKLSLDSIKIMDDSFLFYPPEWFVKFSKEYKSRIGLPFGCLASPRNIDYKKLKLLVDCGLRHIQMGLESGSDRVNYDIYNRGVKSETFLKAIGIIDKLYPRPLLMIDVLFDNPFETRDDKIQTIKVLNRIKKPFEIGCYSLTYYPQTGLYDLARDKGLITKKSEKKIYENSFYNLGHDYMSGLILLTNKSRVSPDLIEFLLKYRPIGYIVGMAMLKARNSRFIQKGLSVIFRKTSNLINKLRETIEPERALRPD